MNSADYQLKHQALGRMPSVWRSLADEGTKAKIRNVLDMSAGGDLIQASREIADVAANEQTFFTNGSFRYIEGNYAVVGRSKLDFSHGEVFVGGATYYVGIQKIDPAPVESAEASPLAKLTEEFTRDLATREFLNPPISDFYIVSVPHGFFPLIISGRDRHLHAGVDFETGSGYLVFHLPPHAILDSGLVICPLVNYKPEDGFDDYVRQGSNRRSNKFLAEYQRKSQSMLAFKRALAEYAGLHVFEAPDVVIRVSVRGNQTAYTMASSGVVIIDYPHDRLQVNDYVEYGQVLSNGLEVSLTHDGSGTSDREVILDGVLPVNGLHFNPNYPVQLLSSGIDPSSGKEHLCPVFNGPVESMDALVLFQKEQELKTGNFLSDHYGDSLFVDFWDLIRNYYGSVSVLVSSGFHNQAIAAKLHYFANKHKPITAALLLSIEYGVYYDHALKDSNGVPMLDDRNTIPLLPMQGAIVVLYVGEDAVYLNGEAVYVPNSTTLQVTTENGEPIIVDNSYVFTESLSGNIGKTELVIDGKIYLKDA